MTETATVETLTAEVRVLMLGNRQITLSVYRQLDEFDYTGLAFKCFTPFGRVNSGTKYILDRETDYYGKTIVTKGEAFLEFIGRDERSGGLVRLVVRTRQELDRLPELIATFNDWDNRLPLIVLAGLR